MEDPTTLTFVNNLRQPIYTFTELFEKFGSLVRVGEAQERVFIQFQNAEEAKAAFLEMREMIIGLKFAKARSTSKESGTNNKNGVSHSMGKKENSEFFKKQTNGYSHTKKDNQFHQKKISGSMNTKRLNLEYSDKKQSANLRNSTVSNSSFTIGREEMNGSAKDSLRRSLIRNDKSSIEVPKDSPPPLVDGKELTKIYSIILGNIPEKYDFDDVYSLVEEAKPVAFAEMDYTAGKKIKFCEIYVKGEENVKYLREKLNGFVISGKKLIAVEPSSLLGGVKWNL